VRAFNHVGPGQSERFVVASIARQIACAEAGLGPRTVQVGRTDTARDFTDVRDVVRAYLLCALRGRPGTIYNVGSGQPRRIVDVAETLAAGTEARVVFDSVPGRVRPGDVLVTQCDASRIRRRTGWTPRIPLEQTLADTLAYWRAIVRNEAVTSTPRSDR
jgi:GDP-4-dehydro-6-deoxy-D-mannose reductase